MQEANFTLRVDNALKTAFAEAARRQDRTAAQLIRDYMRSVVQEPVSRMSTSHGSGPEWKPPGRIFARAVRLPMNRSWRDRRNAVAACWLRPDVRRDDTALVSPRGE